MKRRRSGNTLSNGSRSQSSRSVDRGEILRRVGRAAEEDDADEIEALTIKGVDLSAPAAKGGLPALHRAALAGSTSALCALLRAGADKEAVETSGGRTALHFAALRSKTEVVKALVAKGGNKEARDSDGRTPLHLACIVHSSDPTPATHLIVKGADPLASDAEGVTPLDISVHRGWTVAIRAMVSHGARPCAGNAGLLYDAVRAGNAGVVDALVEGGWEAGAPPAPIATGEVMMGEVFSPLMLAADSGRPDVVRALLRGKCKGFPDAADPRGYTALHLATMRGSEKIAEALLRDGDASRDLANVDGDTALHIAVASRRTHIGEVLLLAGASVSIANRRGHTPLHFAAAMGLAEFAKELLDRGADVGALDGEVSAFANSKVAVTNQARRGANGANIVKSSRACGKGRRKSRGDRKEGRTPLHYAAMRGRVDATRVLLQAGASAGHRWNDKRETPLFVAARGGHADVVGLLLERLSQGYVDVPAASGETPLSVACANGHADVVEQLVRKGADVSLRDPDSYQSPLDMAVTSACTANRGRVVRALLQAGADPDGGGTAAPSPPLHTACRVGGGAEAVEALLDARADADAAPCGGRRLLRPLHIAAVHGNAAAVRALTLKGCRLDVQTLDPSRSTALVLAVQQGHVEAARALIEAGARIDVVPRREDGTERAPSLARLAADMKRGDMVSLLVEALVVRDSAESWTREWAARVEAETGGTDKRIVVVKDGEDGEIGRDGVGNGEIGQEENSAE